jgi:N-methylhydantoinase A/oxoprolinase/acetone carboxylase beta subunit
MFIWQEDPMKYGLGIDTGGTYTDAVIYDFECSGVVSTAKSVTVKEDLTKGISNTLDRLPQEMLRKVGLVSLSTTLATNACVEGKGSRAKLILIGCSEEVAERYGREYGLPEARDILFVDGGHNQQGNVVAEPDWGYLQEQVIESSHRVEAFAVVELWGIRNAHFEIRAKELITEWTGKQVICGYEITGEINSLKRAASALLNAQLIPLVNDFLDAVKTSLKQKEIEAPLAIVRGDGSLMTEAFARCKPVETLLCGPAASVAGGMKLSDKKNCIIIDMGGTTSDIAIVRDGIPGLATEGARVGKWRTGTKSILIHTVGIGGDSLIRHSGENSLSIGPVRVAPLSWAASRWPQLLDKMKTVFEMNKRHTVSLCEFFYLIRDISYDTSYNQEERNICLALKDGPMSVLELAEAAGTSIYDMSMKRLEQHGVVMRCGLTPTDIMHLTGGFTGWNREAAYYGAAVMARQIHSDTAGLIQKVNEGVKEKLYYSIVSMLLEDEEERLLKGGITKQLEELLLGSFHKSRKKAETSEKEDSFFTCSISTQAALVGIGAPAHLFLPDVAKALNTCCVIPENAGVANAIGAVTGNVMVEEKVIIRPQYETAGIAGYIGFSSVDREEFTTHAEAVEWAKMAARTLARQVALDRGAGEVDMAMFVNDLEADVANSYNNDPDRNESALEMTFSGSIAGEAAAGKINKKSGKLLLETVVIARAIGKLKFM